MIITTATTDMYSIGDFVEVNTTTKTSLYNVTEINTAIGCNSFTIKQRIGYKMNLPLKTGKKVAQWKREQCRYGKA